MRTLGSFRKIGGLFLVVVGVAGVCGATYAQADARVITIRLLDSQTGQAIVPIPGDNGIRPARPLASYSSGGCDEGAIRYAGGAGWVWVCVL
ncbi:MAG: hypothetical protein ABSE46_21630 [Terracidiphilus sp.]